MTDESLVPAEPICTCEDRSWLTQIYVDGKLADEALIDTSLPYAQQLTDDLQKMHGALVGAAIAGNKPWTMICKCPNCGKGMKCDSETGTEILGGARVLPKMLHVLSAVSDETPSDARRIPGTLCPHECTASPPTHAMLATPNIEHVVVCIECFMEEEDENVSP